MEVSGVNRLLSLARELGIEPTQARKDLRVERKAAQIPEPNAKQEDGVRLSLSAAASDRMDATILPANELPTPPAETPPSLVEPAPRQRQALAAYARNSAAVTGERIQVRA